jgi:hypothetical protein
MDMQSVEPNRVVLNAELAVEQWNVVFAGLNRMEHGLARPVFDSLVQQLRQQQANVPPAAVRGNGAALPREEDRTHGHA